MKKIQRQERYSRRAPPKSGPAMPPTETTALKRAERPSALRSREGFGNDAHTQRSGKGAANCLKHTKEEEKLDIGRKPCQDGTDGKCDCAAEEDRLLTHHIPQPPHAQHDRCLREGEGEHDPLYECEVHVEFGYERGQHHPDGAAIERGEEDAGAERRQRYATYARQTGVQSA